MEKVKLSACLMVKNEEKNLERCINSIWALGIVSEILIFDTGSTDNTAALAAQLGCVVRIAEDPDEFFVQTGRGRFLNFSKARNESMKGATGDWLLLMDADEEIIGDARKLLPTLAQTKPEIECFCLSFQDIHSGEKSMGFLQPRIFRNGCVEFKNIVHNRPYFKQPAIALKDVDLVIKHYGYDLDNEGREKKWQRTTGLLEKRLEDDPEDWGCYFYLAQQYAGIGQHKKCVDHAVKYIENFSEDPSFNGSIYSTLVQQFMFLEDSEKCDHYLAEAIKKFPTDLDVQSAVIDYGIWLKKPHVLKKGAERFVFAFDKLSADPTYNQTRFIYTFNHYALAKALFHYTTLYFQEAIHVLKRYREVLGIIDNADFTKAAQLDMVKALDQIKPESWRECLGAEESSKVIPIRNRKSKPKSKKQKRKGWK